MKRKLRSFVLLYLLILPASGCASWEGRTEGEVLEAAPTTPGALVTEGWCYVHGGRVVAEEGTWVHLPAGEAGNLLLWVKQAEEKCR